MSNIARYIIGLSSLSFVFAFMYEGQIGLGANLEANRALLEERVRINQTSYTGVNETAVTANMSALDEYNETLKTEYRVYDCSADKACR